MTQCLLVPHVCRLVNLSILVGIVFFLGAAFAFVNVNFFLDFLKSFFVGVFFRTSHFSFTL